MGFLEGLYNVAKGVVHILAEQQAEHDAARAKLEEQGFDDWDEDELEWKMKHAKSFQEQAILGAKLREKNNK